MIKPTMSHAVDKEHLNELLVEFYEKRTDELEEALEDLLNDCINFGSENMTTRILRRAVEVLDS